MRKKLKFENIVLRNDAKCAALCEKRIGSMKEYQNAIFLTLGTGIGGAVFMQNELLRGKNNDGFEIGHMVIKADGDKCTCGNSGCFETYASMKVLKDKIAKKLNLDNLSRRESL